MSSEYQGHVNSYDHTCECGKLVKVRQAKNGKEENNGKWFFKCDGCNTFRWMEVIDDGNAVREVPGQGRKWDPNKKRKADTPAANTLPTFFNKKTDASGCACAAPLAMTDYDPLCQNWTKSWKTKQNNWKTNHVCSIFSPKTV